jgi:hypothetical protein
MADEPTVVDVDVSDEDLFNEAKADQAPEPQVAVAATDEPPPEPGDQPRDEHGRFAPSVTAEGRPKAGDTPAPTDATPPPAEPPPETDGGHIPAWRLREEAENRRAAEARALQYERELAELRRNPPKPAEPPKPQETPDPLLDPAAFQAHMRNEWQEALKAQAGDISLRYARRANPERFDKAYAEAKNASPADRARIRDAPDPGDELLAWYSEREAIREVGPDPAAYKQRILDEALKDPAYLAKAAAALRLSVVPSTGNGLRQPSPVRLPPSLNGITPSGAAIAGDDDTDMSDEAIFRHATTGPRR